jgi:ABC-type transporter Mla MlaB component
MVFSFFKPKKSSGGKTPGPVSASADPPANASAQPNGETAEAEVWDSIMHPNGGHGIEVFEETDLYTETAEHAAILFANGQFDATRSMLESATQNNNEPGALKLWAMLFDLLRVQGEQEAFEALCLEFTHVCELSPPSWGLGQVARGGQDNHHQTADAVVLQGAISGDDAVFDILSQSLSKGEARTLDMHRLVGLDSEASAKLASILRQVRRSDLAWGLLAAETLAKRLAKRTVSGVMVDESQWLLELELLQFLGWEEQFENKAVDYAVTFEVSPPAWEPPKSASAVPWDGSGTQLMEDDGMTTTAINSETLSLDTPMPTALEGEILQGRLDHIENQLLPGKECKLDFSRVTRLDFTSAGALATLLQSAKTGPVIISHVNRLVAELLHVMGVDKIARIELAKY